MMKLSDTDTTDGLNWKTVVFLIKSVVLYFDH